VRDAHHAHGVQLLGHAHHADLRGDGRARAPRDQDGRQHGPELADQRHAQDVDDEGIGPELAQLLRGEVGQHHADQKAHQRRDRQCRGPDAVQVARHIAPGRAARRTQPGGRCPAASGPPFAAGQARPQWFHSTWAPTWSSHSMPRRSQPSAGWCGTFASCSAKGSHSTRWPNSAAPQRPCSSAHGPSGVSEQAMRGCGSVMAMGRRTVRTQSAHGSGWQWHRRHTVAYGAARAAGV
jgi:hypothetical protein